MLKKITVAVLAAVLLAAGAFSLYNVVFAQTTTTAEADGVAVAAGEAVPSNSTTPQTPAATPPATPPATTQQQQRQGQTQPQAQPQDQAQGQVMPQMQGRGQRQMQNQATSTTPPRAAAIAAAPQNNFGAWQTLTGTVSKYAAPNFVLTTADGQEIAAQLGNLSFVNQIGLELADGQTVTVVGGTDKSAGFAIKSIIVDGITYDLRDDAGRPLWTGRGRK
ncbi:MAG: hypothetical protein IPK16_17130 [Anaerolineales bacterium]|nr:hypothetical protein [Anaerolineales bacterium]